MPQPPPPPRGAADAFAPAGWQETALRPPTLGEFAQQFGGSYLSTEVRYGARLLVVTRRAR
ncbi:MAG: hypothetical protein IPG91_17440 [Ideonella sp.]|nr:hypothetical protein [Ideonella sp.]